MQAIKVAGNPARDQNNICLFFQKKYKFILFTRLQTHIK
jgi:hypothetical protein